LWYSTILETYCDILDLIIHNFLKKILFSQSKASLEIDPTFVDKKIGLHTATFAILITKWSLLEFFFSTNVFFSGKFLTRLLWQMFKIFLNNMVWIMFERIFLAGLKKDCIWNCMVIQIYLKNHAFYHTFWMNFSTEIKHFKQSLHPVFKTTNYILLVSPIIITYLILSLLSNLYK
jgi:hypothetical protein